jgi:hypothetical protein
MLYRVFSPTTCWRIVACTANTTGILGQELHGTACTTASVRCRYDLAKRALTRAEHFDIKRMMAQSPRG